MPYKDALQREKMKRLKKANSLAERGLNELMPKAGFVYNEDVGNREPFSFHVEMQNRKEKI